MRLDVPLECLEPMPLPLPGRPQGLIPEPMRHPITERLGNRPYRRVMPGPVAEGPYRVHASADRASPPPERQGLGETVDA